MVQRRGRARTLVRCDGGCGAGFPRARERHVPRYRCAAAVCRLIVILR